VADEHGTGLGLSRHARRREDLCEACARFAEKLVEAGYAARTGAGPRPSPRTLWLREQVAAVMAKSDGPMLTREVAREVGDDREAVLHVLKVMERAGEVERAGSRGTGQKAAIEWRATAELDGPRAVGATEVEQLIAQGLTNSQIVARGVSYEQVHTVRRNLDRVAGAA
jgi:hypothetical protein